MAELATCLTLGSFDPEDVAEIQGFIAANGGDVEAGVSAYEASLAGDLRGLADQVALKSAPEQFVQGKTAEELRDLEELRAAEAEMLSIPETHKVPGYNTAAFWASRQYVGPNGETLDYDGALNAMYEIGAQWAGGPVKQERKATILIGAPAAGKSSIAEKMIAPQQGAMIVDSDEFKKMVPEYQGGIGANAVHEESKVMSDDFTAAVVEAGFNIVIPKVGGNPAKLAKQIEGLKAKGYTVDLAYMQVERNEVMRRMVLRFFNTGRLIPPSYLLEQVDLIDPTYETLKQTGVADGYVKFDNNNAFDEPAIVLEDTRNAGGLSDARGRGDAGGAAGSTQQVDAAQDVTTLFQGPTPIKLDGSAYDPATDPSPSAARRISPRMPSLKSSPEDAATTNLLQIDTDAMRATPAAFEFNADLITTYPSMGDLTGTADEKVAAFQRRVADNLIWLFNSAPEALRERGHQWYDGARAITDAWSERYQLPDNAIAGALAALSPQKDWFQNVSLAERVLDTLAYARDVQWSDEMQAKWESIPSLAKYEDILADIQGKTLQEVIDGGGHDKAIAAWVRIYDETYNDRAYAVLTPEGGLMDPTGQKVAWGSLVEIQKAVNVVLDPSFVNTSEAMGGNHKVRSFYNNIVSPNSTAGDVTIDTHAVAAALVRPLSQAAAEVSHAFGTGLAPAKQPPGYKNSKSAGVSGARGLYGIYADAYRMAAKEVGILPRQMQSVTWEAVRLLYPDAQKRGKMGKAVEAIWQDDALSVEEKRDEAVKRAGGFDEPAWAGSGRAWDDPAGRSTYTGELAFRSGDNGGGRGAGARDGDTGNLPADGRGATPARGRSGDAVATFYQGAMDQGGDGRSGDTAGDVRRGADVLYAGGSRSGAVVTDAETFLKKARAALSSMGPIAAQVGTDTGDQQFLLDDGKSGYALDGTNIISVFSSPDSPPGVAERVLTDAVARGGNRLDGFNTFLPKLYAQHGFKAVARLPFSREYAPTKDGGAGADWDYAAMSKWNGGEPDVTFMVYDPVNATAETDNVVAEYDDGIAAQAAALEETTRTLQQSAAVDTPAFKAWFGDSKIVDANGKARQLFHGTAADVQAFDIAKAGKTDSGWFGRGFYFASDPQEAGSYAGPEGVTMPVYVKVENPFVVEAEGRLKSRDDAVESLFGGLVRAFGGQSHDSDTLRSPQYYTEEKVEEAAARSGEAIAKANEAMSRLTDLPDIKAVMGAIVDLDKLDNFGDVTQEAFVEGSSAVMDKLSERLPAVLAELGFDGVVVVPYGSRDNLQGTLYEVAVFDPTQIKSAFNEGTFDADNPNILKQGPRGQIEIPKVGVGEGTSVIRLFETADESTFMHETAHFFLEVMNDLDAPELAGDMAAIRKFVGAKDGQKGFTTEQHEKFARGFEAYLREGNAPSLAMADAFKLFKTWLTRLYSSVRKLDVQINDEMRQVFDRMLATDEAIADARAAQGLTPLFAERPVGMTDTDWNTYQRMARRSADQAEQNLMTKVMAKLKREKQKWFKDEKAAVIEQVEREYSERREFRLFEALANKRWIGNDEVEADDFRIDKALLIEQFGEDIIPQLNRQALGGGRAIYAEGGSSPSEVAQFFGFKSAKEMVEAVAEAGNLKKSIEAEADRRLLEAYGDPFSDGTLEEEAMQAIHSEQQAAAAVAEARELTRQMGGNPTGMTSRLYAERAKDMLSRMTVGQASKPAQFLAAERRAAREAQQAFARVARGGDAEALSAARTAKERQVLNQHLYNQSIKIKEQVDKGRTKMMGYRKASVREKLDGIYMEQIDGLLDAYDFRVKSPGQVEKAANLTAYVDQMILDGREAELNIDRRLIENARRVHYSKLTVDELQGLFDTIANIDHMGRFKQKLIDRKRKRDLNNSAERVAGAILSNHKLRKKGDDKMGVGYLNLLAKPDTIFIRLDGGDEFGATWEEMKRGIDESTAIEQEMLQKMAEDVNVLYDKHYNHKQLRAMVKEKFHPGLTFPWTKQEIIALALNMGNKDNYQRAMDDRVAEERRLTPQQLDTLLSTLDDNDWRFVQGNIDMVNSYWDGLAEVSKRRTGVTPKKVDAEVMYPGAPSFFKGGYYPIKFDPKYSQKAAKDEQTATDRYMTAGHGSTTQVGNGMTKERQNTGGGRALNYDLHVGFAHMRETIRYTALSEAVDNTYRLLEHPAVFDAMNATGNRNTLDTLKLWLQDVAEGPAFNSDGLNWAARVGKNNFTMSRLSFNMKTVILQVTGITQSAAVIGKRNMLKGMMLYAKHPAQTRRDVLKQSAKMRERSSTFQKDIYDFTNDLEMSSQFANRYKKTKSLIAKAGFMPIVAMQFYVVDMPTWLGAYAKYIDEYNGDAERASLAADKMVERAQDTGLPSERAAFERGTVNEKLRQQDAIRIFTTLGGYMLTKANRAYVRGLQARRQMKQADTTLEAWWAATNAAIDLTVLFAFEALMMGVMWELLDDDDDLEDLNEFMLSETGSAVVGGIPFVRDAAGAFRGYGGGGVVGSMMEAPSRVYTQYGQGEFDRAARSATLNVVGIVTGLPTTATLRGYEAIFDDDVPLAEGLLGQNPLNRR